MTGIKSYYSIPEMAKMCGVSRSTLWDWVKSGYIKAIVTPGGHHRILQEEVDRIFAGRKAGASVSKGTKTVLIVDDEPQLIKLIKGWLSIKDLHIETAMDGFDAGIKLLNNRPHLVILDLFMPGMDGFEICRTIKQDPEFAQTKILALTGFDTPENKRTIMGMGADAYLPKPMDSRSLRIQVETLLEKTE